MAVLKETIVTARTVDEAVARGCEELSLIEEDYKFEIIELPVKKLFSFKPALAKVRVYVEGPDEQPAAQGKPQAASEKKAEKRDEAAGAKKQAAPTPQKQQEKDTVPAQEQAAPVEEEQKPFVETPESEYNAYVLQALQVLQAILDKMELSGLTFQVSQGENEAMIWVKGEQASFLIGRHGETMSALQYILSLTVNRQKEDYYRIILNVENYREKRASALNELARKVAKTVVRTGRSTTLEPMNPYERRIIHSTVQTVEGASSSSIGEEPNRRVVIRSKNPKKKPYGNKPYAGKPGYRGGKDGGHGDRKPYDRDRKPYDRDRGPRPAPAASAPAKEKKSDLPSGELYGKIDLD